MGISYYTSGEEVWEMDGSIVFYVILLICAAVFIAIGIFALNKKSPMHFWSGTEVKAEEITDTKAYNRENGVMWIAYGSSYIICAILRLVLGSAVGGALFLFWSLFGVVIMILAYKHIYKKYKQE